MDPQRARELLEAERERLQELLQSTYEESSNDRAGAGELGDMFDPAESLTAEEQADAIAQGLRQRLAMVERAERRLDDGTYGFSVRSGDPIPDDRLEADPAAELTVDEARER